MRFDNFYANCPVCSPTRASLLSGRYPDLVGVPGVIRTHDANSWGYLSPLFKTLPSVARKAGYDTALIGKWHLGLVSPNTPLERGFTHFHGFLGDMMDDYYHHRRHDINYMYHQTEQIDPLGHATNLFADWTVDYLHERGGQAKPFLIYLAFNAPHSPIQPPSDWLKKVQKRESGMAPQRAKLVALIEHMDDAIGRVLAALKASGKADNTIVVFSSDNGGSLRHGASNGDLNDGKGSVYEGGLKVPTFVVWPGKIASGSRTQLPAMTMDILPTLLDAADVAVDTETIDGRSFLPALLGNSQQPLRSHMYFVRREGGLQYGGKCIDAVREGPWKLMQNFPTEPLKLFNLDDDPQEQNDLVNVRPDIVRRLNAILRRQIQSAGRIPWQGP